MRVSVLSDIYPKKKLLWLVFTDAFIYVYDKSLEISLIYNPLNRVSVVPSHIELMVCLITILGPISKTRYGFQLVK